MAGGAGGLHDVIDDRAAGEVVGGFVAEELITLLRARDRLDAEIARRVAVLDASGEWALDGSRSAAGWLVHHTRAAQADAYRAVKIARQARAMPYVFAAWREGEVSSAHVAVLARARHSAKAPERFAEFESAFADVARAGTPEDCANVARQWRDAVDAARDTHDTIERRQWNGRRLDVAELLDGMVVLGGEADPEAGGYIRRAIDHECDRLRRRNDDRTPAQLRLDALASICRRTLDGEVRGGNRRPHVMLLTDLPTIDGDAVGVCETERGTRISPATMRRIMCDASVSAAVLGSTSEVLDLGRAERTFTPAQRRAILVQYPRCVGIGCDVAAADCDLHHVHWWEHGGPTDVANGVPVCRAEHHRLHEEGWSIERDAATGEVHWYRPDGTHAGSVQPRRRPRPIRIRPRDDDLDELIRARVRGLAHDCAHGRRQTPSTPSTIIANATNTIAAPMKRPATRCTSGRDSPP